MICFVNDIRTVQLEKKSNAMFMIVKLSALPFGSSRSHHQDPEGRDPPSWKEASSQRRRRQRVGQTGTVVRLPRRLAHGCPTQTLLTGENCKWSPQKTRDTKLLGMNFYPQSDKDWPSETSLYHFWSKIFWPNLARIVPG